MFLFTREAHIACRRQTSRPQGTSRSATAEHIVLKNVFCLGRQKTFFSWLRKKDFSERYRALSPRFARCRASAKTARQCCFLPALRASLAVRIPRLYSQNKSHPVGWLLFWLRKKDSNPHKQSQSLSCYLYTIPQNESAGIMIAHSPRFVKTEKQFFTGENSS